MEPRLEQEEIEFFQEVMRTKGEQTKMVEWGSGGSTVLFLPYFEKGKLTSIEHNRTWYHKVSEHVERMDLSPEIRNSFTYIWRPPTYLGHPVSLAFHGYGIPYEESPTFVADYINPEPSSGEKIFDADIYFVDGIARGAVLATILRKAKNREARVFLHDSHGPENREEWYRWATDLYTSIQRVGPTLSELRI